MFSRRAPELDLALLSRVSDVTEVNLGTYPEAALAVVGAYPSPHELDHRPEDSSSFRRLDSQARTAAMQSALDQLIAERTLSLAGGRSLEKVVDDGLNGKLAVNGPLADLYELSFWLHRRGYRARAVNGMWTSEGLEGVRMPDGVCAPGIETCFGVQPPGITMRGISVLLVERQDERAGTRSYVLRTVRREFSRVAAFLFADVTGDGEALGVYTAMSFRFGQASLTVRNDLVRKVGGDEAIGTMTFETKRARQKKQEEPVYVKVSSSGELADVMTKQFADVAATGS
jgi:hypothetical protein